MHLWISVEIIYGQPQSFFISESHFLTEKAKNVADVLVLYHYIHIKDL